MQLSGRHWPLNVVPHDLDWEPETRGRSPIGRQLLRREACAVGRMGGHAQSRARVVLAAGEGVERSLSDMEGGLIFSRGQPAESPEGPGTRYHRAARRENGRAMLGLVIFDCDGVLVDSERLGVKVDVQVLARLGWHISEEEVIERFVGVSDADFEREIEEHTGRALPDDWRDEIEPLYRSVFAAELRPVDGIVEALDQIDVPTCVASSGTHEKMRYTLGLTGLYERFRGRIFSASEVTRGKPAPDLFLYAAERMGAEPASCVVVEDSIHGVAAARAAGMQVFAYGGGVTPAAKLAGPNTIVFSDMRELPRLLELYAGAERPVQPGDRLREPID